MASRRDRHPTGDALKIGTLSAPAFRIHKLVHDLQCADNHGDVRNMDVREADGCAGAVRDTLRDRERRLAKPRAIKWHK